MEKWLEIPRNTIIDSICLGRSNFWTIVLVVWEIGRSKARPIPSFQSCLLFANIATFSPNQVLNEPVRSCGSVGWWEPEVTLASEKAHEFRNPNWLNMLRVDETKLDATV
ncbi:unnamed protein product [Protopolystoma xenopodis]|uniref:Uncharacterized protein n=1 Tax=Protopolystoma xenopodis TaxID=117903 RepID=A0A3S5CQ51_9PLAT|nr:unnamed protein product [Protopolystoma xenopodis]